VADNRRTSTRHAVSIPGKLVIDGAPGDCTVLNLSLGGALIGGAKKLPMGHRVNITFAVPTVEEAIDIGATVRWSDGSGLGLQFDGLRARDVWALNKYFEQLAP
jgi:hypothetical protein